MPDREAELLDFLEGELGPGRIAVETEGPEGEIAVLRVPPAALPRLLEAGLRGRVVERARAAGYRYAAVDLGGEAGPAGGAGPRGEA